MEGKIKGNGRKKGRKNKREWNWNKGDKRKKKGDKINEERELKGIFSSNRLVNQVFETIIIRTFIIISIIIFINYILNQANN